VQLLPQPIANGLLLGGIYAVLALGFSLVCGVLSTINVAHGAFVMLGAYVAFPSCSTAWGIEPFVGTLVAFGVPFALGYVLQSGLLNLVVRSPIFTTLIPTLSRAPAQPYTASDHSGWSECRS
jgi:branched-chain amino acid transport system permease protein